MYHDEITIGGCKVGIKEVPALDINGHNIGPAFIASYEDTDGYAAYATAPTKAQACDSLAGMLVEKEAAQEKEG